MQLQTLHDLEAKTHVHGFCFLLFPPPRHIFQQVCCVVVAGKCVVAAAGTTRVSYSQLLEYTEVCTFNGF